MASLDSKITFGFELRPCFVGEEKGLFHHWEDYSQLYGESLMVGGHGAGQVSQTFGLVEYEDGSIKRVQPYDIRFCDGEFECYFDGKKGKVVK